MKESQSTDWPVGTSQTRRVESSDWEEKRRGGGGGADRREHSVRHAPLPKTVATKQTAKHEKEKSERKIK